MTTPGEEPQPGRGRGAPRRNAGGTAGAVTAGFKVDASSLTSLVNQWAALVKHVTQFNAQLAKIDGKKLDALSGRMGGGRSTTNTVNGGGGTFSTASSSGGGIAYYPIGGAAATSATFSAATGNVGKQQLGGNPKFSWKDPKTQLKAVGAVIGAVGAYGNSQKSDWMTAERLGQMAAWQTDNGNGYSVGQNTNLARHSFSNLTGYTSPSDLYSGLGMIQANQGLGFGSRSQQFQAGAGRIGNLVGGYQQGASAAVNLASPQSFYSLMRMGVYTRSPGGGQKSPEQIAQDILTSRFGGKMPTTNQLAAGSEAGSYLRETLNSAGLNQDTQSFVLTYGETAAKLRAAGKGATYTDMQNVLSKTGNAKGILGDTLFDRYRQLSQAQSQASQTVADSGLPDMKDAVKTTTGLFRGLNTVLSHSPLLTGLLGAGSAVGGPVTGAAGKLASGPLGYLLYDAWRTRKAAGAGAGPAAGMLGRLGAGGALKAVGGLGVGAVAGDVTASVAGHYGANGLAQSAIRWGGAGAGLGAMLGGGIFSPEGAAIGGGIGALFGVGKHLFEGGGAGYDEASATDAGLNSFGGLTLPRQRSSSASTVLSGAGSGTATGLGGGISAVGARAASSLAWMRAQSSHPTQNWLDWCMRAVRTALRVPQGAGTAAAAYAATKFRHAMGTPPAGVPVWWGGGAGHVALSAGGGQVWSTDILRKGQIDLVPLSEITSKWGKPYEGWTEDINGVRVYGGAGGSVMTTASGTSVMRASAVTGGGGNEAAIAAFLAGKGLTPAQIAGVLGNFKVESGFSPTNSNPAEGAIGLAQWEGGRRTALDAYAKRTGGSETNLNTQLGYLWAELTGGESAALRALRATTTPGAAASVFDQLFERSSGAARSQRIAYANQIAVKGYKTGAWEIQGDQLAAIHHGEMVVPAEPARKIRSYISGQTSGGRSQGGGVSIVLNMPIHVAAGTSATDAAALVQKVSKRMATDSRIAALMNGG